MKINVFLATATPNLSAEKGILLNMAEGIAKHDVCHIIEHNQYDECDVAVCLWSPKEDYRGDWSKFNREVFLKQKERSKLTLIIESAFFRSAKPIHWRVGFNDVGRLAEFANADSPPDRWDNLKIPLKPWKNNGDHILIIGQLPGDYSLGGLDFNKWVEDIIPLIRHHTDKKIIFRTHPKLKQRGYSLPNIQIPISTTIDDVTNSFATISYSSGMSIDSIIMGIPTITLSERSMVWDISGHALSQLENIPKNDRIQCLSNIAYAQWTTDEIKRGLPWYRLRQYAINTIGDR
ncbi:MAG: hypothetical protein WC284_16260 [Candidimonas sp.]